ncbi:MATE family efflux transporter [Spirosoma fluviale]|uniref:Na+-driven multidrug efflux pump n=1 Tax=Spirosoma fluviale TaxID=1597977 RepID=A0A286GS34_9BACT|nr:MATE family efflux transporter [Spirosoma fluviale]SOD98330.1 Na+-driven multidrug efflux pump [Spirosoma fluviale]
MQAANRVAKNTGLLYARMAVTIFISLYATRVLLGALGTKDFGIYNLVGGAVAMLTFLNTAMAAATQRFMSFAHGAGDLYKLKKIFNVSVILHLLIAILVLILLEIVGYFLFNGILNIPETRVAATKIIYQATIVSTLFTILSVPYDATINSRENMAFFAVTSTIESVCKLSIALYIKETLFDKLIAYSFLSASLTIVILIINRVYCHRKYAECKLQLRKDFDKNLFKEMASFGGWSFLGSMVAMLNNYGQGIVVNRFFGTTVNAAQGISNQITGQLGAFSSVMLKALNPIIVKSAGGGNKGQMISSIMTGSKLSYFLLSFFAIPVIIEMPTILDLWLGKTPEYAVIFCRLLLIRNLIEQLFVTLPVSIAAVGRIKYYQLSISFLAIFPLLISWLLFTINFPPYYLYIVFIVQVTIRSFGIVLYFAKKECGLSIILYIKDVIIRCLSTSLIVIIFSTITVYMIPPGIMRLLIIFSLNIILMIVTVSWFGLIKTEKEKIIALVNNLTGKLTKHNLYIKYKA